ncbi:MAG: dihydrolipoyllysine-residue succinyltransferase [Planctomycetaceae bacterium]|nr:MAG: dihydrolipoyllysine-residue succinyltransferase [Planctomycetaceae bacterium]
MVHELKIPQAGESIQEVQIGQWFKREGQWVEQDETLVELETDKASMELSAPAAGVLTKILKVEGDPAEIDEVIALIDEKASVEQKAPAESEPGPLPKPIVIMPAAQRLLSEHGLQGREVEATGPGGRLLKEDVLRHIEQSAEAETGEAQEKTAAVPAPEEESRPAETPPAASPNGESPNAESPNAESIPAEPAKKEATSTTAAAAAPKAPSTTQDTPAAKTPEPSAPSPVRQESLPQDRVTATEGARQEEAVPMSLIRRRIAERLVQAQHEAALLTTFNEIDMSAVLQMRKDYRQRFEEKFQCKLGFMSFFTKATIEALKEFPALNAEVRGREIIYRNFYDVGIAIGSGRGLVVPVIRNAERLSFAEIELQILDFAKRAEQNKLRPEDMTGGTFTITNGGVYGSLLSTPIINPPQSGVLGLHAIQERPIADQGQVVIRPMMYVALTYDHRIVDGREAVTFLRRIKDIIEQPARMLLEV